MLASSGRGLPHIQPSTSLTKFSCPHCGAIAHQIWFAGGAFTKGVNFTPYSSQAASLAAALSKTGNTVGGGSAEPKLTISMSGTDRASPINDLWFSRCAHCLEIGIWSGKRLLYPQIFTTVAASADMPAEVKAIYLEAAAIVDGSPRAAAALLRVAVEILCTRLGGKGKNLSDDIAKLVRRGLDERVQKMLDIVRVTGNNALHPERIGLTDTEEIAQKLFGLINLIVEIMITQPKQIQTLYGDLPPKDLAQIARRDGLDQASDEPESDG